jgi:hypothetical protein
VMFPKYWPILIIGEVVRYLSGPIPPSPVQ